jgi:hypothetical protein
MIAGQQATGDRRVGDYPPIPIRADKPAKEQNISRDWNLNAS